MSSINEYVILNLIQNLPALNKLFLVGRSWIGVQDDAIRLVIKLIAFTIPRLRSRWQNRLSLGWHFHTGNIIL